MSGREIYDVSPIQRKIIEEKYQRRLKLRHEYLKQRLNPFRHALGIGGHVEDPAILRYTAHRATIWDRFKPTWGNFAVTFSITALPIIVSIILIGGDRDRTELKRRRGEVSYHDRDGKFV